MAPLTRRNSVAKSIVETVTDAPHGRSKAGKQGVYAIARRKGVNGIAREDGRKRPDVLRGLWTGVNAPVLRRAMGGDP